MLNPIELPKASNKIQSELVHSLLLKGFWDTSKEHHHTAWSYMLLLLIFKVTLKPIGHLVQMIVEALVDIVYSLVPTWFHGPPTKKKVVSRGSAESEYQALASLTIEIMWDPIYLERTLHSSSSSLVWCDNKSVAALAANSVFHACSKHIESNFHFIRDKVL